jgi:DNA-binding PadR family transcriptional regulator
MDNQAPLTEAILLVLLSLAEEPRHGYAIIKDVEQMTTGRVHMSTGTLFGALQRLLEQGWIQPVEEEESPRGRRVYRLTPVGRRNLKHEFARMKDLTRIGDLRISRGRA